MLARRSDLSIMLWPRWLYVCGNDDTCVRTDAKRWRSIYACNTCSEEGALPGEHNHAPAA